MARRKLNGAAERLKVYNFVTENCEKLDDGLAAWKGEWDDTKAAQYLGVPLGAIKIARQELVGSLKRWAKTPSSPAQVDEEELMRKMTAGLQEKLHAWQDQLVERWRERFHEKVRSTIDDHTKLVAEVARLKVKVGFLCKELGVKEEK